MEKQPMRDPVFDVMKGIGIIFMLIGHIPPGDQVYHFIYSFHMPLFFLIAGGFAKFECDWKGLVVKDAKRLLLPVFVTMAFIIVLSPLCFFINGNYNGVIAQLLSLLWLGDAFNTKWGLVTIDSMWFLMALFWTKCLFRGLWKLCSRIQKLHDEIILSICVSLSFVVVLLHGSLTPMPLGILKGLSAIQFYAIGWYLKNHKLPKWVYVLFVGCWLLALKFGGVDMVRYYYGCYPLDVVGAIGATFVVYGLSKMICAYLPKTSMFFQWFGLNSLLILCVNSLDRKTYLVRAIKYVLGLKLTGNSSVLFHYIIEAVLVLTLLSVSVFRRIYGSTRWKEIRSN